MISRLEALGYVNRETNPTDRRMEVVNLTSAGRTAVGSVNEVWRQGDEIIEEALGPEDAKRLFALARKLSSALGGGPPKKEIAD